MESEIRRYLREGESYVRNRAIADIERTRKGLFELRFFKNGKPVQQNLRAVLKQTDLDFNFGANIFMLEQYEAEEKNRLYEKEFLKIFNSASIPLYWEGTEPQEGHLRYDRGMPNDVYRRLPAVEVADFCEAHGLRMKGHPLFWHEFIPSWLTKYTFTEQKKLIAKRFREIAERFANRCERFDVVNEPSRIYDVYMRDRARGGSFLLPEDDYCLWLFDLARQLFPSNTLILNDTVGASFHEFRGKYSGYYLNVKDLLSRGARIDEIGMQCHLGDHGGENVYNGERLYNVLDTYAALGKPINISEISIPSEFDGVIDEDLQAEAAEQLYKICFSHPAVTGLTWWNLPDDGVAATKQRMAGDENMPSTGLIGSDYHEKKAYQVLRKLIREQWHTDAHVDVPQGVAAFRGFYGHYDLAVCDGQREIHKKIHLSPELSRIQRIDLDD